LDLVSIQTPQAFPFLLTKDLAVGDFLALTETQFRLHIHSVA